MGLASFSGFDCLQYMQIQRGKAWEIWSCVMTSDRQRADGQGVVPNKILKSICPRAGCQSVRQYHSSFTMPETYYSWTLPPVYLPSVYLTSPHVTKSPRPSPSVFTYCKPSKTGGGNSLGTRLHWASMILNELVECRSLWGEPEGVRHAVSASTHNKQCMAL